MESRGWILHRIWSTDWFQRPDEQIGGVLAALAKAKLHWQEVDSSDGGSAKVFAGKIRQNEIDGSAYWTRLEVSNVVDSEETFKDLYVEATLRIDDFTGSPNTLSEQQIQELISKILEIEAPMHVDEIGRRVIALLGQERLVASLKNKIDAAVTSLSRCRRAERRGDFVYKLSQVEFPVRCRKNVANANLRKVEFIAPEELQAAIINVVTEGIGTGTEETVVSTARLLGISNGQLTAECIEKKIRNLTADRSIADRDGKLFVGV